MFPHISLLVHINYGHGAELCILMPEKPLEMCVSVRWGHHLRKNVQILAEIALLC